MTEHDPRTFIRSTAVRPVRYLLVPGLNDSGPDHWQSRWQACRDDCVRVDLGDWGSPMRAGWVGRLAFAIEETDGPLVLVGHSLGCLAILWWAAEAGRAATAKVAGAMLVAPPDVGQQGCDLRLLRFAPVPPEKLSFPALVVASEDDPYASLARSRAFANSLGATFSNAGKLGHINAASHLGDWADGQTLLAALTIDAAGGEGARPAPRPARDSDPCRLRDRIAGMDAEAVIPSKGNRKGAVPHDAGIYEHRNRIER